MFMLGWTIFLVDGSQEYAKNITINKGYVSYTKVGINKENQTQEFKTIIPLCNILKIVEK